ncbi:type II and III secretion system protein family protein [Sulfitobacter sp. DFL-23]|uniref:Putative type IV piliation system protein n=2 Tax=Pseudosulfitobacter pseudonitzschiae TaxID=1402135 RepID=A0A221K7D9_9RHOB|nr:type II and III secretion system protein family protein [Sulfitobacter sp. DFL-23]ASM74924.1 putative type IV piliation system protein [Pseudosulfitobacter pseudonitzschiae]
MLRLLPPATKFHVIFMLGAFLLYLPAASHAQTFIESNGRPVQLFAGEGKLIKLDTPSETVFLANPEIADVEIKSPTLLYIYGKSMGETTLFVIDASDEVSVASSVKVSTNVKALNGAARASVQGGKFSIVEVDGALVMTGRVGTIRDAEQVQNIVQTLAGDAVPVVNSLSLDTPAQVNLQVKIAEVSRTVTEDLGTNWTTLSGNGLTGGNAVSGGYSLASQFSVGNSLQGVTLEALKNEGLVTILSEPNLTARSGDKATFLAGGRFPYQTQSGDGEVRVVFEPFGVELDFEPEVMRSDKIKLMVNTKIRELDFSNGSTTDLQNLPLILERSAATTIEVSSGQSFAIAGLFKATSQQNIKQIPGLGEIPLLGALFRSTSFQKGETELVIIVTPYLVEPSAPGKLKTPLEKFAPADRLSRNFLGELTFGAADDGGPVSVKSINGKAGLLLQ